jgi:2,3-dihydroxy-p-cumate/2,3-dihydroxybenzoate 3,4-dioxygenase
MITHMVLFRFTDAATPEERASLLAEIAGFPAEFPQMHDFVMGENRSTRDDRYSHAFCIRFDTEDELQAYLTSHRHETFVSERWRPIIAERSIASIVG